MDGFVDSGLSLSRRTNHQQVIAGVVAAVADHDQLVYECLQNADDATGVSSASFEITETELVVSNNGTFRSCGHLEADLCDLDGSHQCDFHRIRDVSNAEKADEAGTTGAFGLGFNAVYRITDKPMLVSGGVHWQFDDTQAEENKRIDICGGDGCNWNCRTRPETTFVLPWAFQTDSPGREIFQAPPVTPDWITEFEAVVNRSAPMALLFARRLTRITVTNRAGSRSVFSKSRDGQEVELLLPDETQRWRVFEGDFQESAQLLRDKMPEAFSRSGSKDALVQIAVRGDDADVSGLMHSVFPTGQPVHLPAHLNAEVFPEISRRQLITTGEKGEWNRAALDAVGKLLASTIISIRDSLATPERFWHLLDCTYKLHLMQGSSLPGLAGYWSTLRGVLREEPVVWSESGSWLVPSLVFTRTTEFDHLLEGVLAGIGIEVVNHDIRASSDQVVFDEIGVGELELPDLTAALEQFRLPNPSTDSDFPEAIANSEGRSAIWLECERLLEYNANGREALADLPLWPSCHGDYRPAQDLFRASRATQELATEWSLGLIFLDTDTMPEKTRRLRNLVPEFTTNAMVSALERAFRDGLPVDHSGDRSVIHLFQWLLDRPDELEDRDLRTRLGKLPLFPTRSSCRPIEEVFLPGDFNDPLGHAFIVDTKLLGATLLLLEVLEAKELDLATYCTDLLPDLLELADLEDADRRRLVEMLADHCDEIDDKPALQATLSKLNLIECINPAGNFRPPDEIYFDSEIIHLVLGPDAPIATPVSSPSQRLLLEILGVANEPRHSDVVRSATRIADNGHSAEAVNRVRKMIRYIGSRWADTDESDRTVLEDLRTLSWLPMEGSSLWWTGAELDDHFGKETYETTGDFLDCPGAIQNSCADFLRWLGLRRTPDTIQVTNHLLNLSDLCRDTPATIYRLLDQRVKSPGSDRESPDETSAALAKLRNARCLSVGTISVDNQDSDELRTEYRYPWEVFLHNPHLGIYGMELAHEYESYPYLLPFLNVKKEPDAADAERVLKLLSSRHSKSVEPLAQGDRSVVERCWQLLQQSIDAVDEADRDHGDLAPIFGRLRKKRVVLNDAGILVRPLSVVLNDSPRRFRYLPSASQKALIDPHELTYQALQRAGVKRLTNSLKARVTNIADLVGEDDLAPIVLAQRLVDRAQLLLRAFSGESSDARERVERFVQQVEVSTGNRVKVLFRVPDAVAEFGPVEVKALLKEEREGSGRWELYYAADGEEPPWSDIASELIPALCPERRTYHQLIPLIVAVLQADSFEEASAQLDDYDVPRLKSGDLGQVESPVAAYSPDSDAVGSQASDIDEESGEPDHRRLTEAPLAEHVAGVGQAARSDSDDQRISGRHDDSVIRTDERDTGTIAPGDQSKRTERLSPDSAEHSRSFHSSDGIPSMPHSSRTSDAPRGRRSSMRYPSPRTGRMVSYIEPSGEESGSDESESSAIGARGENVVVAYEASCGRKAHRMDTSEGFNEGYDIESLNSEDEVVRYIEVKSTEYAWQERGVSMTSAQFRHSREKGPNYWLYVVEFLGSPDERIFRIHDPASRVDRYALDHGWKGLSEDEAPEKAQ
jgi:hypothetical protein